MMSKGLNDRRVHGNPRPSLPSQPILLPFWLHLRHQRESAQLREKTALVPTFGIYIYVMVYTKD